MEQRQIRGAIKTRVARMSSNVASRLQASLLANSSWLPTVYDFSVDLGKEYGGGMFRSLRTSCTCFQQIPSLALGLRLQKSDRDTSTCCVYLHVSACCFKRSSLLGLLRGVTITRTDIVDCIGDIELELPSILPISGRRRAR